MAKTPTKDEPRDGDKPGAPPWRPELDKPTDKRTARFNIDPSDLRITPPESPLPGRE